MLGGKPLSGQFAEKNVLFLAVMGPVGVGPEKIDCRLDEAGIDVFLFPAPVRFLREETGHLFDQPVFPHERSDQFHRCASFFLTLMHLNYTCP